MNRYIAIKSTTSIATGVAVGTMLAMIGVDFPVLWGVIAFMLNYVPTFGSIFATALGVFWALLQLGPVHAGFAAGGYVAINVVVGSVVEPKFMGRALSLSNAGRVPFPGFLGLDARAGGHAAFGAADNGGETGAGSESAQRVVGAPTRPRGRAGNRRGRKLRRGRTVSYERENIRRMEGYRYGEQPDDPGVVKLNTNENPYPPSPAVAAALAAFDADELRRYPPAQSDGFRRLAAGQLGLTAEEILVTNGGDEALRLAFTTFVDPGSVFAMAYPSYSLYEVLARVQGCRIESIPLADDWSLPADFCARANRVGARLTCLVNPHAPSGVLLDVVALAPDRRRDRRRGADRRGVCGLRGPGARPRCHATHPRIRQSPVVAHVEQGVFAGGLALRFPARKSATGGTDCHQDAGQLQPRTCSRKRSPAPRTPMGHTPATLGDACVARARR